MLQAWHHANIVTGAGYILGFPADTPESIRQDVEMLQRELPLDLVNFSCLMPLPGSVDHRDKLLAGEWMDPDLNLYTGEKAVTHHPRMSRQQWEAALWQSWRSFYSHEHVSTSMRRCEAEQRRSVVLLGQMLRDLLNIHFDGVQPLEGGVLRRKCRTQRRPGLPRENPLVFYPRRLWEFVSTYVPAICYTLRLIRLRHRIKYHEQPVAVPPRPLPSEPPLKPGRMHPHHASERPVSSGTRS